jgi:hypothetical protein
MELTMKTTVSILFAAALALYPRRRMPSFSISRP